MERDTQRRADAANRMATHRERRRKGQRWVPAILWEREVVQLVHLGHLAPDATGDKRAIAVALGKLFDRVLR